MCWFISTVMTINACMMQFLMRRQIIKKVYYINYYRPAKNAKNVKPTSLEQFLGLIKHASMVFTASYHGMLFSIYFHRQVFSFLYESP